MPFLVFACISFISQGRLSSLSNEIDSMKVLVNHSIPSCQENYREYLRLKQKAVGLSLSKSSLLMDLGCDNLFICRNGATFEGACQPLTGIMAGSTKFTMTLELMLCITCFLRSHTIT